MTLPKLISTLLLVFGITIFLQAQEGSDYVIIENFEFEGNKKTREKTITREMDFGIGDTLSFKDLQTRLEKNQVLLLNTGLFYEVDLTVRSWAEDNRVSISVKVREAWYIYPIPIFELADRNFNVWWVQQNRSLKRINFGVRMYYANITGRKDLLKGVLQFGYTQKYELEYTMPFINEAQTLGFTTNFLVTRNREVGLRTINNDVDFYREDDDFMLRRYRYGFGLTYRPGLYQQHKLEASYFHRVVADTVAFQNPDFLLDGNTKQRYPAIGYTFKHDQRDLKAYPMSGFYAEAEITKEGFGLFKDHNRLFLTGTYAQFIPIGEKKKYGIGLIGKGRVQMLRNKPAYYSNRALGYEEDYIRGYEFYVIDGSDFGYLKTSVRYEIFKKRINWKKAMPFKAFKIMPFRIFLVTNFDMGYVNDPHYDFENPLANDLLLGGGVGLDFVIYVDKVIQIEYSVNRLGEKGVFLHYNLSF